jgi:Ca2+-binding EF-hand superfamily protein
MFKQMDADNNGSVTQAEFLASKPGDMTDDQATQLFQSIDSSSTGSITQDQLTKYMQENGPQKDAAASASGAASSGSSSDSASLAQDLLKQLMQVIQNFNSSYVDGAASTAAADSTAIG